MTRSTKSIATGLLAILAVLMGPAGVQAQNHTGHSPPPFATFDMDGNGSVSEAEFNSVREQRMAARASEGKQMRCAKFAPTFADLDSDGSGDLSQQELSSGQKAHMAKCKGMGQGGGHGQGMHGNRPMFSDFDLDGNGFIVESEFNEAHAKRMSEMAEQGRQMKHAGEAPGFSGIDTNGDGVISEQEFSEHQSAHHGQRHGNQ